MSDVDDILIKKQNTSILDLTTVDFEFSVKIGRDFLLFSKIFGIMAVVLKFLRI